MLQQVQSFYEQIPLDVKVSIESGVMHEIQEALGAQARVRVRLPNGSVHETPTAAAAHQLRREVVVVEPAAPSRHVRVILVVPVGIIHSVGIAVRTPRVAVSLVRVGARVCGAQSTVVPAVRAHLLLTRRILDGIEVLFAPAGVGPRLAVLPLDIPRDVTDPAHRQPLGWRVALVDHAVTLLVIHHDGRGDVQLCLFSPVELHVPRLPPRQHERPIFLGPKAHLFVMHVVEDSVVHSSHRGMKGHPIHPFQRLREGVGPLRGEVGTSVTTVGELAVVSSMLRGSELLGALEHGVRALEQLGQGLTPRGRRHGEQPYHRGGSRRLFLFTDPSSFETL